ncbi:MAG: glycosyltransferase [Nitrospirota bacterium]|nr:glycosyltransferase [Nitrospirota bacterium]
MIERAFTACAPTNALVGILSEARDHRGIRGLLRLCHSLLFERAYRERTDFVLAVGTLGIRWFQRTKYNPDRIFPWGYFVEQPVVTFPHTNEDRDGITFAYVGQLIDRKGVDVLLRALEQVERAGWRLQLVGHGKSSGALMRLARKLGIDRHVDFLGVRPNPEVRSMLAQADALILPSRFDGWGAVVTEALMSGVPVICSDHCGAADLIELSHHGEVVRAGSVEGLTAALARMIDRGPLSLPSRERIRRWSDCLDGAHAARYFLEIVRHCEEGGPKPTAPWRVASEVVNS